MSNSGLEIVVENNNRLLKLLSIKERKNDDLLIVPKFAESFREVGSDVVGPKISNQHYSVHCSINSIEGINAIKHTLLLDNNQEDITSLYTKALKKNNLFSPLYLCRCPDLQNVRYQTIGKNSCIKLGDYDSAKGMMYYLILVGNSEQSFDEVSEMDLNTKTIQFKKFSITILWSFCSMPPDPTGCKVHFYTVPGLSSQMVEGFTKEQIIALFKLYRQIVQDELVNIRINTFPEVADAILKISSLGFKKVPH